MNKKGQLIVCLIGLSFLTILLSCKQNSKLSDTVSVVPDTVVRSEEFSTQIAGSNYLIKSERFFLIIKNDTSDFSCLINQSKEDGSYTMNLSFYAGHANYFDRLREFSKMLLPISQKYNLDSLKSIYLGRLIYYGDLAVSITGSYQNKYDLGKKIEDYQGISTFLMNTQLAHDFDTILKPYSVSIKKISAEKIFFADKAELLSLSKITANPDSIPDKILDCMVGYILVKSNGHKSNLFSRLLLYAIKAV